MIPVAAIHVTSPQVMAAEVAGDHQDVPEATHSLRGAAGVQPTVAQRAVHKPNRSVRILSGDAKSGPHDPTTHSVSG